MEIDPWMCRGDDLAGFWEMDILFSAGEIDEDIGALTAKRAFQPDDEAIASVNCLE